MKARGDAAPPWWLLYAFAPYLGFACLLVMAILLRSRNLFLDPRLNVEDASVLFSHYYGASRPLTDIVRSFNGYPRLLPEFIAWCLSCLPTLWQPHAYALAALGVWTATFAAIASSPLWDSRRNGLCLGFLLAVGCFNQPLYFHNLMYSQWPLLLLSCVLSMERMAPRVSAERLAINTLALLIALPTQPYVILLIPILVMAVALNRAAAQRAQSLALIGLILLYFAFVDRSKSNLAAVTDFHAWMAGLDILVERVVLLSYFQVNATPEMTPDKLGLAALLIALYLYCLAPCLAEPRKLLDPINGALIYIILAFTGFYLVSYRFGNYGELAQPRYYFVQQYCWLVLLFRTGALHASRCHGPRILRWAPQITLGLLVLLSHFTQLGRIANTPWGPDRLKHLRAIVELENTSREPTRYVAPGPFGFDVVVMPRAGTTR